MSSGALSGAANVKDVIDLTNLLNPETQKKRQHIHWVFARPKEGGFLNPPEFTRPEVWDHLLQCYRNSRVVIAPGVGKSGRRGGGFSPHNPFTPTSKGLSFCLFHFSKRHAFFHHLFNLDLGRARPGPVTLKLFARRTQFFDRSIV